MDKLSSNIKQAPALRDSSTDAQFST